MNYKGLKEEAIHRLIALEVDGRLTPDAVVKDAEDPASPLHSYFDWDDTTAAKKYREHQARQVIQAVKVEIVYETTLVNATYYTRDPDAEPGEQGYVAVPAIADEHDLAMRALAREIERIERTVERARGTARALGLESVLDEALTALTPVLQAMRAAA